MLPTFSKIYFVLCRSKKVHFGMTWWWVNNEKNRGLNIPLSRAKTVGYMYIALRFVHSTHLLFLAVEVAPGQLPVSLAQSRDIRYWHPAVKRDCTARPGASAGDAEQVTHTSWTEAKGELANRSTPAAEPHPTHRDKRPRSINKVSRRIIFNTVHIFQSMKIEKLS